MTLQRIQALRDLDYGQLAELAAQRGLIKRMPGTREAREWSPDRLRLRLIDSIVEEELEIGRQIKTRREKVEEIRAREEQANTPPDELKARRRVKAETGRVALHIEDPNA